MKFTFKVKQKIKEVWVLYKENINVILLFTLLTLVLDSIKQRHNFPLTILMIFVSVLLSYVWARSALNLIDTKEFKPFSKESLPDIKQYWNFLSTNILMGLIFLGGLILFIIPGFYFMGRLAFASYISVDKNKSAEDSIKESWNMTRDHGWSIFWKGFLIGLFILLGVLALFVGLFITYPIGIIIFAMLYREFQKYKNSTSVVETK